MFSLNIIKILAELGDQITSICLIPDPKSADEKIALSLYHSNVVLIYNVSRSQPEKYLISPVQGTVITAMIYYADSYKEELVIGLQNGESVVFDILRQTLLKHIVNEGEVQSTNPVLDYIALPGQNRLIRLQRNERRLFFTDMIAFSNIHSAITNLYPEDVHITKICLLPLQPHNLNDRNIIFFYIKHVLKFTN